MKRIEFKDLILFEDDDLIVINKQPFISTLEDRNDPENVLSIGRRYFDDLQVCHRLDKDTSGCLILAKKDESYRHISMQLQNHQVRKVYHAIVEGRHAYDNIAIDAPIHVRSAGGAKIDFRKGKESLTRVSTIETFRKHSLLECIPTTGRLHQIRVHLAYINSPITGDGRYGGQPFYLSHIKPKYTKSKHDERPLIRRFALHARRIEFTNSEGNKVSFTADYPKDFNVLLRQLRKHR